MPDSLHKDQRFFGKPDNDVFVDATIHFVDTVNNVFQAVSHDGLRFLRNCQYIQMTEGGSCNIEHPSAGDSCRIRITPDGVCHLDKIYTPTYSNAKGIPQVDLGTNTKFMPGDRVFGAKGGSFLQLLRNGLTKIGVSPLCQLIFSKVESYVRLVARSMDIMCSGFRFYSVNNNGVNVTRLSIFLTDPTSTVLRDTSSLSSDFEITANESAITIMTGPKSEDGLRKNATELVLVKDGSILLFQTDPKTKNIVRRLSFTPDGCASHEIYDGSSNNVVVYEKNINKTSAGVSVSEHLTGDYTLNVDGHLGITSKKDVEINGNNVFSYAEKVNSTQCVAHLIDADVRS